MSLCLPICAAAALTLGRVSRILKRERLCRLVESVSGQRLASWCPAPFLSRSVLLSHARLIHIRSERRQYLKSDGATLSLSLIEEYADSAKMMCVT